MSGREPAAPAAGGERLEHPALAAAEGLAIAEARCTDRAKLGVVLQGAGLLSLCDAAGWSLVSGWSAARIDGAGRLTGVAIRPGRDRSAVQPRLHDLLFGLFRARGRVAGRGEARRAARDLTAIWSSSLVPMSSDDAIGVLFDVAPFLWSPEFVLAHSALVGGFERDGRRTDWVAGPPIVRQRLRLGPGPQVVDAAAAAELAAAGRWSEAVRRWQESPPAGEAEKLLLGESLYSLGRFEAALLAVAESETNAALALRAGCRLLLGELAAARETMERLRVRELALAERLEHGDTALRIFAVTGDREAAADWVAQAVAGARSQGDRAAAALLQATAAMDAGDAAAAERYLVRAAPADGEAPAWRWLEVRVWLAEIDSDGAALVEHGRALLAARRRRMRRFEAGRAWNNLGIGYLLLDDLERAEHAFAQSVRLLRRCDGPLAFTLPLTNLAEVRLRAGKLFEVESILRASMAHNRRSQNSRALAVDELLWIRFELVRGQPEVALERAGAAFESCRRRGWAAQGCAVAALAARAAGRLGRTDEAARWLDEAGETGLRELDRDEQPAVLALAGRTEAARAAARSLPLAPLWTALLAGEEPSGAELARLAELSPFRRARTVLDGEQVVRGSMPKECRAQAAATFRRLGADRWAVELERRDAGFWEALTAYLERPAGEARTELATLFREAGHPEASLQLRRDGAEEVLVAGTGEATEELSAEAAGTTWVLRAAKSDAALRALLALVRREPLRPLRPASSAAPDLESGVVGRSPRLLAALERLRHFAATEMPVLLLGESGTGKELAAKEVRRRSARARGPWVAVNCAALSENLLLSDLFGHARGAFTGADRPHAGVFETAHGGTVFLDEIGDLPPAAQGNLLRVLQEGEVRRLGESLPRKVDVRLVAATHRDLPAMVREGRFRQDLYYRLKVCTVTMPPLRERGDDVELLAEAFLEAERRRLGLPHLHLTAAARRRLRAHSWPGNVRELAHVLKAAAALTGDGPVDASALDLESPDEELPSSDYHREVDDFRRAMIRRALAAHGGNRAAAARQLGVSRQALSYLVRELGLADEPES